MKSRFLCLYHAYGRFLTWTAVLAGCAIFAVMWLVDASALSRKLFNAPIVGSVEITQSLMTLCIMLPMGYAQSRRSHLRVVLLTRRLGVHWARRLYVLSLLAAMLFFVMVGWSTFDFAYRSVTIDEYIWGAQIRFPVYPAKAVVCLGSALLAIQFLLDAIKVGIFGLTDTADELIFASPPEGHDNG